MPDTGATGAGSTAERHGTMRNWSQRLDAAVKADEHWRDLPAVARLDRVFKESGVRDLVIAVCDLEAEVERMRADLRAIRDHAALDHSERGLCEATRYLAPTRHALGEAP